MIPAYEYTCRVLDVVDGDTVDVLISLGFRMTTVQRIRLSGVDCPEIHAKDEFERRAAQEAKQFTQNWVEVNQLTNKGVLIEEFPLAISTLKDPDSFGRWLGTIFVPGQLTLNTRLTLDGRATLWPTRWRETNLGPYKKEHAND